MSFRIRWNSMLYNLGMEWEWRFNICDFMGKNQRQQNGNFQLLVLIGNNWVIADVKSHQFIQTY